MKTTDSKICATVVKLLHDLAKIDFSDQIIALRGQSYYLSPFRSYEHHSRIVDEARAQAKRICDLELLFERLTRTSIYMYVLDVFLYISNLRNKTTYIN